ncbi:MAG: hypothetical protein ACOX0S_07225 [Paludibacteraceae bacterium]
MVIIQLIIILKEGDILITMTDLSKAGDTLVIQRKFLNIQE